MWAMQKPRAVFPALSRQGQRGRWESPAYRQAGIGQVKEEKKAVYGG